MATLTGQRTYGRRAHLRLVTADDRPVDDQWNVCVTPDPTPGPRDAADLVSRFRALLPADVDLTHDQD
ncbi:MAG: hypothetical protein ACXVJ7_12735 [Acidimicrobiia bacterium]